MRYYLLLHFIVLLWGFTPILGKAISFGEFKLVLWRIFLTAPAIFAFALWKNSSLRLPLRDLLKVLGVGLIVGLHWIFFYGAIKVSNVSITMAAFSCGALITAFVEPLFYKRKIDRIEILFGALIIGAIILITRVEFGYVHGVILGVLAAVGSAFFSVFNGMLVKKGLKPSVISFYEMAGGGVGLLIYGIFSGDVSGDTFVMNPEDLGWLLILSLVCTAFTFIASVEIMKEINPYTINLTVNLESVYAIILAYFIFTDTESMSLSFYLGAGVIFLAVLSNGWIKFYRKK
jgi:drug/metabolite transporter (DMT)-like permease